VSLFPRPGNCSRRPGRESRPAGAARGPANIAVHSLKRGVTGKPGIFLKAAQFFSRITGQSDSGLVDSKPARLSTNVAGMRSRNLPAGAAIPNHGYEGSEP